MSVKNCDYCMQGGVLDSLYIKICDLDASTLFLFREQSHKGRCMVCSKWHVDEIADLTEKQRNAFLADVCRTAKAIHAAFSPDRINYGAYNDKGHHAHFHLVPKYQNDSFEWSTTFAMNPNRVFLTNEEYTEVIERIRRQL